MAEGSGQAAETHTQKQLKIQEGQAGVEKQLRQQTAQMQSAHQQQLATQWHKISEKEREKEKMAKANQDEKAALLVEKEKVLQDATKRLRKDKAHLEAL